MGGRGSGKTLMLKRVAEGKPYVAYIPFGLVSSVNSMVDIIAEEVCSALSVHLDDIGFWRN